MAKIHQGRLVRLVHLYFCRFLFIFNFFDIAFISVILTAGLFQSGQPAQYKCYKGFMVSCLSIQPCHVNSSLNLLKKYILIVQMKAIVLCVPKLISCSRTKPKHQFIVASSLCIEKLLMNIWSFIPQPIAAKKDYSCLKFRLYFESLIS